MLILQRKTSESITINSNIKITILEIGTDKVKIAIEAPKEIPIVRSELIEAVNSNLEAAENSQVTINAFKKLFIPNDDI